MYFNNMIEYTLLKRNLNVEPMGKNLLLLIVTLLFLILKFSNTVEATRVYITDYSKEFFLTVWYWWATWIFSIPT